MIFLKHLWLAFVILIPSVTLSMKLITATIKPIQLDEVKNALLATGENEIIVTDVKSFQPKHTERYRGALYTVDVLPKVKIEVIAGDEKVEKVTQTILESARTGKIGDGRITVTPIEQVIRIRTGEPVEDITADVEVGKVYTGTVVDILDFGAFVQITPGIKGLVHISEIAHERVDDVKKHLKVGDKVEVKVLGFESGQKKINLSIKKATAAP
jgi:nitrogen regulatory protein PII